MNIETIPPIVWELLEFLAEHPEFKSKFKIPAHIRDSAWIIAQGWTPPLVVTIGYMLSPHGWTALELRKAQPTTPTGASRPQAKPKRKPGRRSTEERDIEIAEEFAAGRARREWRTQVEYLKNRHKRRFDEDANAAKAWLSTLLRRVRELSERQPD